MKWLVFALIPVLSGCWFVYIPTGMFQQQTWCVSEHARVGSPVAMRDGRRATVKALYGRSEACQDATIPIRADLEFQA